MELTAEREAQEVTANLNTDSMQQEDNQEIETTEEVIDSMNAQELTQAIEKLEDFKKGAKSPKEQELVEKASAGFISSYKKKLTAESKKQDGIMARAKAKFEQQQQQKAHEEEKEMKDMLDNPLTALYNAQHPEVVANAKERQY